MCFRRIFSELEALFFYYRWFFCYAFLSLFDVLTVRMKVQKSIIKKISNLRHRNSRKLVKLFTDTHYPPQTTAQRTFQNTVSSSP